MTVVSLRTKLTILGLAGLAFCGILVETSLNVTFPTLMRQFNVSLTAAQWVTTAYLLVVAITMSVTAFSETRFTARQLVITGTSLFVIGGVICALASNLIWLLTGRVIQGVATGIAIPLFFSTIMRQVPASRQGIYVGTGGVVIALAPSLGPTYGGLVNQMLNWRMIFWFILPVGIIFGTLAAVNTIKTPTDKRHFPLVQFCLIAVALSGLVIGITEIRQLLGVAALVIGLIALTGFIWMATHIRQPLIDVRIFTHRTFIRAVLIYFLVQFMQIGQTILIPTYAQIVWHLGSFGAGLILMAGAVLSAFLGPLTGRWFDQYGIRFVLAVGCSLMLISTAGTWLLAGHLTLPIMLAGNILYELGFCAVFNNTLTFGLQQLPKQNIGDGNASFNTLQQYAGSLGTTLMAAMLAMRGTTAAATANSAWWCYALLFGLSLVVAVAAWGIHPKSSLQSEG
ncbi:MFS transporter [Secundilactobacillus folii]|uniref:MFS transporter n=1 Tax=Secundilactobacillus folii TaxID=2678357 RepID=A0A7X3C2G7_9LACO|nr:MFS transporter [Secundilactobacillus folii]MTV81467.1 MFS transporter [Secundilactobacillus folii]